MWPFTRTIIHRIEGMDDLVAALRENAAARRYQGECVAGLVEPKPEPGAKARVERVAKEKSAAEIAFDDWVDAQGFPEAQRQHYRGLYAVMVGRNPAPPHYSREKCMAALDAAGAPIPGAFTPEA